MKNILSRSLLLLLFVSQILFGCRQAPKQESYKVAEEKTQDTPQGFANIKSKSVRQTTDNQAISDNKIPQKVYDILKYVRENGNAPSGYVGGRKFGNYENLLPKKEAGGRRINYQEWDVNPKQQGRNRGAERLITGSDNRAYFTKNHYKSFVEIE